MKTRIGAGALAVCLASYAAVAEAQASIEAGADWLLTQQFPSGAYPWTVGLTTVEPKTQGTTARGMLAAFDVANDPAYLDSAVRTGDFLVDSYPRHFTDGDPDFFPLDPLFLEELTHLTGDSRYSDFVETNLWSKLTAGTYGEANNQTAAAWAAAIPTFPEFPWNSLTPVFRASPAIAAHYRGHTAIRDALMASVLNRLNLTTGTSVILRRGDLTALAAAIWASAHTGYNLDPTAGRWASAANTQGLVNSLVFYQRVGGDWPSDTSGVASTAVGDVSVTSWAVWALKAWNPTTYASRISSATSFILAQQRVSGQILAGPGYAPTVATGVEVHGEALVALASDDGVLLDDVPTLSVLGPTSVNLLVSVQVKLEHGPGNARDWVGLYPTGATSDFDPLDWKYLDGAHEVPSAGVRTSTLTFRMPSQPGTYHVRLFRDNSYTRVAVSPTITVVSTPVALTVLGSTTVNGFSKVQVSVTQGPGNLTDWVGLYASASSDTEYISWQYMNGTRTPPTTGMTSATLTFSMPNVAGTYTFRFFPLNSYLRLATSATVTVANVTPTVTAVVPGPVSPGASVLVQVANGPGNVRDWVGLYRVGDPNSALRDWKYLSGTRTPPASGLGSASLTFTMPTSPGSYEFRLFSNGTYDLVATSPPVIVQ